MSPSNSDRLIAFGRVCYGAGIAGLGVQHWVIADFVPVILASPTALPGPEIWPHLVGFGLLISGVCLVLGKKTRAVALALGVTLTVFLAAKNIPIQVATGTVWPIYVWNNPLKLLVLLGGAFAVAGATPGLAITRMNDVYIALGCVALSLTCAIFGFEHFMVPQFVATLVPSWIPWHLFWTYFCGAALQAAGLAMLARIQARLAAGLLGLMIFAWFLVLHIPRALADPHSGHGNEWSSVFEALAFSGIAFILSQTLPSRKS